MIPTRLHIFLGPAALITVSAAILLTIISRFVSGLLSIIGVSEIWIWGILLPGLVGVLTALLLFPGLAGKGLTWLGRKLVKAPFSGFDVERLTIRPWRVVIEGVQLHRKPLVMTVEALHLSYDVSSKMITTKFFGLRVTREKPVGTTPQPNNNEVMEENDDSPLPSVTPPPPPPTSKPRTTTTTTTRMFDGKSLVLGLIKTLRVEISSFEISDKASSDCSCRARDVLFQVWHQAKTKKTPRHLKASFDVGILSLNLGSEPALECTRITTIYENGACTFSTGLYRAILSSTSFQRANEFASVFRTSHGPSIPPPPGKRIPSSTTTTTPFHHTLTRLNSLDAGDSLVCSLPDMIFAWKDNKGVCMKIRSSFDASISKSSVRAALAAPGVWLSSNAKTNHANIFNPSSMNETITECDWNIDSIAVQIGTTATRVDCEITMAGARMHVTPLDVEYLQRAHLETLRLSRRRSSSSGISAPLPPSAKLRLEIQVKATIADNLFTISPGDKSEEEDDDDDDDDDFSATTTFPHRLAQSVPVIMSLPCVEFGLSGVLVVGGGGTGLVTRASSLPPPSPLDIANASCTVQHGVTIGFGSHTVFRTSRDCAVDVSPHLLKVTVDSVWGVVACASVARLFWLWERYDTHLSRWKDNIEATRTILEAEMAASGGGGGMGSSPPTPVGFQSFDDAVFDRSMATPSTTTTTGGLIAAATKSTQQRLINIHVSNITVDLNLGYHTVSMSLPLLTHTLERTEVESIAINVSRSSQQFHVLDVIQIIIQWIPSPPQIEVNKLQFRLDKDLELGVCANEYFAQRKALNIILRSPRRTSSPTPLPASSSSSSFGGQGEGSLELEAEHVKKYATRWIGFCLHELDITLDDDDVEDHDKFACGGFFSKNRANKIPTGGNPILRATMKTIKGRCNVLMSWVTTPVGSLSDLVLVKRPCPRRITHAMWTRVEILKWLTRADASSCPPHALDAALAHGMADLISMDLADVQMEEGTVTLSDHPLPMVHVHKLDLGATSRVVFADIRRIASALRAVTVTLAEPGSHDEGEQQSDILVHSTSSTIPTKVYYHIHNATCSRASFVSGECLNPALVALDRALVRLLPPTSDTTSLRLGWWDKARYMLHGSASVHVTDKFEMTWLLTSPFVLTDTLYLSCSTVKLSDYKDPDLELVPRASHNDTRLWDIEAENVYIDVNNKPQPIQELARVLHLPVCRLLVSLGWYCDKAGDHYVHLHHADAVDGNSVKDLYRDFRSKSLDFGLDMEASGFSDFDAHARYPAITLCWRQVYPSLVAAYRGLIPPSPNPIPLDVPSLGRTLKKISFNVRVERPHVLWYEDRVSSYALLLRGRKIDSRVMLRRVSDTAPFEHDAVLSQYAGVEGYFLSRRAAKRTCWGDEFGLGDGYLFGIGLPEAPFVLVPAMRLTLGRWFKLADRDPVSTTSGTAEEEEGHDSRTAYRLCVDESRLLWTLDVRDRVFRFFATLSYVIRAEARLHDDLVRNFLPPQEVQMAQVAFKNKTRLMPAGSAVFAPMRREEANSHLDTSLSQQQQQQQNPQPRMHMWLASRSWERGSRGSGSVGDDGATTPVGNAVVPPLPTNMSAMPDHNQTTRLPTCSTNKVSADGIEKTMEESFLEYTLELRWAQVCLASGKARVALASKLTTLKAFYMYLEEAESSIPVSLMRKEIDVLVKHTTMHTTWVEQSGSTRWCASERPANASFCLNSDNFSPEDTKYVSGRPLIHWKSPDERHRMSAAAFSQRTAATLLNVTGGIDLMSGVGLMSNSKGLKLLLDASRAVSKNFDIYSSVMYSDVQDPTLERVAWTEEFRLTDVVYTDLQGGTRVPPAYLGLHVPSIFARVRSRDFFAVLFTVRDLLLVAPPPDVKELADKAEKEARMELLKRSKRIAHLLPSGSHNSGAAAGNVDTTPPGTGLLEPYYEKLHVANDKQLKAMVEQICSQSASLKLASGGVGMLQRIVYEVGKATLVLSEDLPVPQQQQHQAQVAAAAAAAFIAESEASAGPAGSKLSDPPSTELPWSMPTEKTRAGVIIANDANTQRSSDLDDKRFPSQQDRLEATVVGLKGDHSFAIDESTLVELEVMKLIVADTHFSHRVLDSNLPATGSDALTVPMIRVDARTSRPIKFSNYRVTVYELLQIHLFPATRYRLKLRVDPKVVSFLKKYLVEDSETDFGSKNAIGNNGGGGGGAGSGNNNNTITKITDTVVDRRSSTLGGAVVKAKRSGDFINEDDVASVGEMANVMTGTPTTIQPPSAMPAKSIMDGPTQQSQGTVLARFSNRFKGMFSTRQTSFDVGPSTVDGVPVLVADEATVLQQQQHHDDDTVDMTVVTNPPPLPPFNVGYGKSNTPQMIRSGWVKRLSVPKPLQKRPEPVVLNPWTSTVSRSNLMKLWSRSSSTSHGGAILEFHKNEIISSFNVRAPRALIPLTQVRWLRRSRDPTAPKGTLDLFYAASNGEGVFTFVPEELGIKSGGGNAGKNATSLETLLWVAAMLPGLRPNVIEKDLFMEVVYSGEPVIETMLAKSRAMMVSPIQNIGGGNNSKAVSLKNFSTAPLASSHVMVMADEDNSPQWRKKTDVGVSQDIAVVDLQQEAQQQQIMSLNSGTLLAPVDEVVDIAYFKYARVGQLAIEASLHNFVVIGIIKRLVTITPSTFHHQLWNWSKAFDKVKVMYTRKLITAVTTSVATEGGGGSVKSSGVGGGDDDGPSTAVVPAPSTLHATVAPTSTTPPQPNSTIPTRIVPSRILAYSAAFIISGKKKTGTSQQHGGGNDGKDAGVAQTAATNTPPVVVDEGDNVMDHITSRPDVKYTLVFGNHAKVLSFGTGGGAGGKM